MCSIHHASILFEVSISSLKTLYRRQQRRWKRGRRRRESRKSEVQMNRGEKASASFMFAFSHCESLNFGLSIPVTRVRSFTRFFFVLSLSVFQMEPPFTHYDFRE